MVFRSDIGNAGNNKLTLICQATYISPSHHEIYKPNPGLT